MSKYIASTGISMNENEDGNKGLPKKKQPLNSIQTQSKIPSQPNPIKSKLLQPSSKLATNMKKTHKENIQDPSALISNSKTETLNSNAANNTTPVNTRSVKTTVTPNSSKPLNASSTNNANKSTPTNKLPTSNIKTPNSKLANDIKMPTYGIHKNDLVYKKTPSRPISSGNNASASKSIASASKTIKEDAPISFIYNGKDYTEVCNNKALYEYKGPGYIVEFDCNPKYLKGLIVDKGLWKVNSLPDYTPDPSMIDLGPILHINRIDVPEKKTPLKLCPLDSSFSHSASQFMKKNTSISHEFLNVEKKCPLKAKKGLGVRFAEHVEKIDPPKLGVQSSNSSPQINRMFDDCLNLSEDCFELKSDLNISVEKKTKVNPIRRSFSLSDINKLTLIESDQELSTDKSLQDQLLICSNQTKVINVTFDKNSFNSSNEETTFQLKLNYHNELILPINNQIPASSPIVQQKHQQQTINENNKLEIDFEKINKSLQLCIDNFMENPEMSKFKDNLVANKDTTQLFANLSNNNDNLLSLKTKSKEETLKFLSLTDSLESCIKFYRNNLIVDLE